MARLTKRDLHIINTALALLEADDVENDEFSNDIHDDEDAQEAYVARIAAVRRKIWDRLGDDIGVRD